MLIVLSAEEYPMVPGVERWFYIHPNDANCKFFVPAGAAAVCTKPLLGKFMGGKPYRIVNYDEEHGWISVLFIENEDVYKMPLYLFARHFDAEAFVKRENSEVRESIPAPISYYKPAMPIWKHCSLRPSMPCRPAWNGASQGRPSGTHGSRSSSPPSWTPSLA